MSALPWRGEVFVILGARLRQEYLLKNMIGLYRPMAGRIFIAGEDIVRRRGRQAGHPAQIRRRLPGRRLVRSMNLIDNIGLPLEEYKPDSTPPPGG